MVHLRQVLDRIRHRLLYVPIAFLVVGIVLSQVMLTIDDRYDQGSLPRVLETTVESGRAILSAIAGGLISAVTLLLSLMLVAVQLASSQFSPRTLRDWLGDRTQQVTIGIVLGTTIYCLLILRQTKSFTEGKALTPHLSVILAVLLGIASLIAVVRSVDHLTDRLRVESVTARLASQTVALVEGSKLLGGGAPPGPPVRGKSMIEPPPGALVVESKVSGWVQQVDSNAIAALAPEGGTAYIAIAVGGFLLPSAPVTWIWPAPESPERCCEDVHGAIAVGDTRTMQQDVGFGILQMVDVALRALSPGINDPNTAKGIVVHLGVVMLALWERETPDTSRQVEGRTVYHEHLDHGDHLHAAFDQIRRYGAGDAEVAATVLSTLEGLRSETRRRQLPGPVEPIEQVMAQMLAAIDASDLAAHDKAELHRLVSDLDASPW